MLIKILSAFTSLLILTCLSTAQPTLPPPPSAAPTPAAAPPSNDSEQYIEAHNQARSDVGVGPLRWSPPLAKSASLTVRLQRDKHNCSFANLNNSRYGGNQLMASGIWMTPRAAVEAWVAEKRFYNYEKNTCEAGHQCGTYTQVVWKKTAVVGCAQAECSKGRSSLTICFYDPPGNVVGEKPY